MAGLEILKSIAQVAAPAGLALGVFLFIARDIIAKNIFPQITKERAYRVIMTLVVLSGIIVLVAIAAWTYVEINKTKEIVEHDPRTVSAAKPFIKMNPKLDKNFLVFYKKVYFTSFYDHETKSVDGYLTLNNDSKQSLREALEWIAGYGNRVKNIILIGSFDCDNTSEAYSQNIASRNANAVKSYIISNGVNSKKIYIESWGCRLSSDLYKHTTEDIVTNNRNRWVAIGINLNE